MDVAPKERYWDEGLAGASAPSSLGRAARIAGCLLASVAGFSSRAEFDAQRYLAYNVGGISLRPQLEVAETFDSNLFYNEQDEISDFFTSVRPGLFALYGEPTAERGANYVSLRYTMDASIYAERNDLNNVGHFVNHQTRYTFSRLSVQADDNFTFTKSLLGGTFSYVQRRIGQIALEDLWRADYILSPRTSLGVKVGLDYVDYDASDLQPYHLYDFLSYVGGMRFGYLPTERITVYPEFTYTKNTLSANNSTVREAPDLTAYGFLVGAEGEFTPKLTGFASVGYEIRDYEDDTDAPSGWVAGLQLRWQARPKTAISVGYRRTVSVSRESFGTAYTTHRPSVSIVQELGTQRRWSVQLDARYQLDNYDVDTVVNGEVIQRENDLVRLNIRANFRWQPWLTASAGYELLTYSDNIPSIQDYEVHRISLRLVGGY